MEAIAHLYIGDAITSMQKTSLVPGANDCLSYTTISGIIGILVPFMSRDVSYEANSSHIIDFIHLFVHPFSLIR